MTPLLAFDTAGPQCAACLLTDAAPVIRVDAMTKGQAEHLMPMLEEMLAGAGLVWRDLKALGVGTGPGNFTGVRIAVSAARGLALGLGVPAVGVTHLEAQVFDFDRPATALVAAPRNQMYVQDFADETGSDVTMLPADNPRVIAALPSRAPAEIILNIAKIAAVRAQKDPPRPTPFYVRPADAAPPRDKPPVILT